MRLICLYIYVIFVGVLELNIKIVIEILDLFFVYFQQMRLNLNYGIKWFN